MIDPKLVAEMTAICTTWSTKLINKKTCKTESLLNSSFVTDGLDMPYRVHSAISRSIDSSLGSLHEKLLIAISERYNSETATVLQTKKATSGRKHRIDLKFHRTNHAYLFEIKLHCELDNKKAEAESKELLRHKTIYARESKISSKNIHAFLGVIGNKDGNKPSDFYMGRLTPSFSRAEVLVEQELYDMVSGRKGFFAEFKKFYAQVVIPVINNTIRTIEHKYIQS